MTTPLDTAVPDIPQRRPEPMRWGLAIRSLRALLADADDTAKARDVFLAIGARSQERQFQRFVTDEAGRALLEQRPSLVDALSDRATLEGMPANSFGRAYQAYADANEVSARGLVELRYSTQARWEREYGIEPLDPYRSWYSDRMIVSHDLFHVLTDYGTDEIGEATLLAFTLAQLPGFDGALLTFGAALELGRRRIVRGWFRYDYRAWRRGRRARWLPTAPWEQLLPLPLEQVRSQLEIEPATRTHPGGILRAKPDGNGGFALDTA